MARGAPLWVVYLSSSIALSGIQVVLPALPEIQRDLALSAAQVSLIISIYVLPSALFAIPGGLLSDLLGRRLMLTVALFLFGAGGVYLLFRHSYGELLAVRAVQGLSFAVVVPLGITIIGDLQGPRQVAAQGRRVVSMNLANALLPVAGGVLTAAAWYAPFAIQALALPMSAAAWRVLSDDRDRSRATRVPTLDVLRLAVRSPMVGVEMTAFLRFFFRYAFLTYLPILMFQRLGSAPFLIGAALGMAALTGIIGALSASSLAARFQAKILLIGSLVGIGATFAALALAHNVSVVLVSVVVYGLSDGIYTVVHSTLLARAAPRGARASLVSLTGAIKNLGQMTGPLAVAGALLFVSLGGAMSLLGVSAVITSGLIPLVRLHDAGGAETPASGQAVLSE